MSIWTPATVGLIASGTFSFSALMALRGTGRQARMSKWRWLADPNPLIVGAATLWLPGPRWIRSRKHRTSLNHNEAAIRAQPGEWDRYINLSDEFAAWNDLETAVALALPASVIGLILSVIALHG